MERGRSGRDDIFHGFGDPFGGFPGFGGRPGSLISSFFGGRDPFDDPFFTQPFGGMMGPSMMGPSMFGPSMFSHMGGPFGESSNGGFLEQQAPPPPVKPTGPIIQEIYSDGDEGEDEGNKITDKKKDNPRKHYRSIMEPYVHDPDEEVEEKKSRSMQHRNEFNRTGAARPQAQTYSVHSSTVTHGGANGAYYTASTTRRMGGDGVCIWYVFFMFSHLILMGCYHWYFWYVVMEENKEADTTTGRASHRVSRGLHDKGHTVMRKLNSDGRVDSLQTLHNLNEDELPVFNEAWKGKAEQHLPGWNRGYNMLDNSNSSGTGGRRDEQRRSGWALPSTGQPRTTTNSEGKLQSRPSSFGKRDR